MTDITKLPHKWRTVEHFSSMSLDCADELEAALPTWTRITEDESTWPEPLKIYLVQYNGILVFTHWNPAIESFWVSHEWVGVNDGVIEYREECGLDRPPEES